LLLLFTAGVQRSRRYRLLSFRQAGAQTACSGRELLRRLCLACDDLDASLGVLGQERIHEALFLRQQFRRVHAGLGELAVCHQCRD